MRVLSADPLTRSMLLRLLAPGDEPEGEARGVRFDATAGELTAQALQHAAEVLLVDVGVRADSLELLRSDAPHAPILALVPDASFVMPAIALGASGAVSRDISAEGLVAALTAMAQGLAVFEQAFLSTLVADHPGSGVLAEHVEPLTPREREVLLLLAEGHSNRIIAQRLSISEHTAKFHVNAILTKLGAQRRVDAVVRAARLGILDL